LPSDRFSSLPRARILTPSVAARGAIDPTAVAVAEARDIAKTQ
jgi:hypothetical protein